jgi:hypothetical protein
MPDPATVLLTGFITLTVKHFYDCVVGTDAIVVGQGYRRDSVRVGFKLGAERRVVWCGG